MPNALHENQGIIEGIHIAHNWEYANAAARTGATGLIADEVYRLALQLDDKSLWLLTATTPTWSQISPGTGAWLLAKGGTGAALTAVDGGLVYSGASALAISAVADLQWNNSTKQLILGVAAVGSATGRLVFKTGTTVADGIEFGTGADRVSLYRSAADVLTTDDMLVAATFQSTILQSGAASDLLLKYNT